MRPFRLAAPIVLLALLAPAVGAGWSGPSLPSTNWTRSIVGVDAFPFTMTSAWGNARVIAADNGARFVVVEHPASFPLDVALAAVPGVRFVEPDAADAMVALWTPNDPGFASQGSLVTVRAPDAWELTRGSTSVKVAILDSGARRSHEDLGNVAAGVDFTGSWTVNDQCGHGTHVAGIAGATTGNGVGVAGAAQATIIPVKVLSSRCSGYFSDVARGITWATDQGADVISMSLGCSGCTSQAVVDAVDYAVSRGALVLAAAGNAGPCTNCVSFPATLPQVMAVGCTTNSDVVCSYSSRGPEVEIVAPGDNILSTTRTGAYGTMSGTSMSTPLVAGGAALILAREPNLSPAALRERLASTARDLGTPGRDTNYGRGRLDMAAALGTSGSAPVARFTAGIDGLRVGVDGSGSSDADGSVVSWAWTWGDGSQGSGRTASHVYAAAGTYTITLTVTDNDGRTGRTAGTVEVIAAPTGSYVETFDAGAPAGWTLTGLWRVGADCAGGASAPSSLQYNRAGACTFHTGTRTSGTATLALDTSGIDTPRLTFRQRFEVERSSASYDRMQVQVSRDGGASWTILLAQDSRSAPVGAFTQVDLDLAAYQGKQTQIRFVFDSLDGYYNAYLGWAIDDVRIA